MPTICALVGCSADRMLSAIVAEQNFGNHRGFWSTLDLDGNVHLNLDSPCDVCDLGYGGAETNAAIHRNWRWKADPIRAVVYSH